jgi:hypothetical protein
MSLSSVRGELDTLFANALAQQDQVQDLSLAVHANNQAHGRIPPEPNAVRPRFKAEVSRPRTSNMMRSS